MDLYGWYGSGWEILVREDKLAAAPSVYAPGRVPALLVERGLVDRGFGYG